MKNLSAVPRAPTPPLAMPLQLSGFSLVGAGRDLTAALIVSLAAISFYLSAASLLFQGALASHLPVAIGAALLGSAVLAVFGAIQASLPLASVGAEPATVPVFAAITAGVAAQAAAPAALATAVMALAITGLGIGAAWWVMGRRGGGDIIRYIPYPVIGGFLGSIGWLMLTGGMGVAVGQSFSPGAAWGWLLAADLRLGVGVALGVSIWWTTLRVRHVLTLPGAIVVAGLALHAGLWLTGLDLAQAQAKGWLLPTFSRTLPVWPWSPEQLVAVQWDVVARQSGLMLSAVIVATLALLLSDTSLEVAWEEKSDINRDLRVLGQGNLLAAALGGIAGGISISRSLLNRQAGAASRFSSLAKAGLCLLALGWGGPAIALVPRPLLGGLLFYLGIGMFKTWVIDSRSRLSRRDYLTVLVMVIITALLGFLPAVCVGVLACCLDFALSSARLSPLRRLVARSAWPSKAERSTAQLEYLQTVAQRMVIAELQGVLFFGSATLLTQNVEALLDGPTPPERLLFDFQRVRWIDSSAAQAFGRLLKLARRHGVRVDISQPSDPVRHALQSAGFLGSDGPLVHPDIDAAVAAWDDEALSVAQIAEGTFEAWLAQALPEGQAAQQVMSYFESLTLAPGDLLFSQGEPSDALYLVHSGRLLVQVQIDGHDITVRSIHAGGAIGEMGLFRATPRSATLRAERHSVVLRLHQQRLAALEAQHPALAAALYRVFLRQLSGRLEQMTAQANALAM